MTPEGTVPKWPSEPAVRRLENCRKMLNLHEFLSDAENERVRKRIQKWIKKESGKS